MDAIVYSIGYYIIIHGAVWAGLKGAHMAMAAVDAERHYLIERHLRDGHFAKFNFCDHLDCQARKKTKVSFIEA